MSICPTCQCQNDAVVQDFTVSNSGIYVYSVYRAARHYRVGLSPGGTQESFMRVGTATRSKPLSFDIPFFDRKGTPFTYLPCRKWLAFRISTS